MEKFFTFLGAMVTIFVIVWFATVMTSAMNSMPKKGSLTTSPIVAQVLEAPRG